jgi:CRISPR-associated protein Cas5h
LRLISFTISAAFAAFKDPTSTSNQLAQYIPSKSAVIGILGAMIGIQRTSSLTELYSKEYVDFFKKVKIGIKLESKPSKITFFTNHRSLKEAKTKPFKTELIDSPKYTIYVKTDEDIRKKIENSIKNNQFEYSPYLGHAYCPAIVKDLHTIETKPVEPLGKNTQCVLLDESETYNGEFDCSIEQVTADAGSIIVERHIHHFYDKDKLDGRVLKHWIPTGNAEMAIEEYSTSNLTEFYELDKGIVCVY